MKPIEEMDRIELLEYQAMIKKDISKYKNLQLAKKVQLNSAYGAIGNQYFRFFDVAGSSVQLYLAQLYCFLILKAAGL